MAIWDRLNAPLRAHTTNINARPGDKDNLPEGVRKKIVGQIEPLRELVTSQFDKKTGVQGDKAERELGAQLDKLRDRMLDYEVRLAVYDREIEALKNLRTQEYRADLFEKLRLFLFRMATGIGLAAVLLGTYWIADKLEIRMPLRMPDVAAPVQVPLTNPIPALPRAPPGST